MNITKLNILSVKQDNIYIQNNLNLDENILDIINPNENLNDDSISISDKAKELLDKHNQLIKDRLEVIEQLRDIEDTPPDPSVICLQIAMRIMNGDKVPTKDMKFLLENDPQMYSKALMFKSQNDNPKKYKSLLADEKDNIDVDLASNISKEENLEVILEVTPSIEE